MTEIDTGRLSALSISCHSCNLFKYFTVDLLPAWKHTEGHLLENERSGKEGSGKAFRDTERKKEEDTEGMKVKRAGCASPLSLYVTCL